MSHALLEKLWAVADAEAARSGEDASLMFEPIGLWLERPLGRLEYCSTPLNSSTFAETGGDGVHYGLLHVGGEIRDESPIIMTVPMAGRNVIVGRDLHEFLCLGCELGYFPLEQLVYEREETIHLLGRAEAVWQNRFRDDEDFYRSHPDRASELGVRLRREQSLLNLLRAEFGLKPWEGVSERLTDLQDQHLPLLELAPPAAASPAAAPRPRSAPLGRILGALRRLLSDRGAET